VLFYTEIFSPHPPVINPDVTRGIDPPHPPRILRTRLVRLFLSGFRCLVDLCIGFLFLLAREGEKIDIKYLKVLI
jgi:hypothetical protein